MRYEHILVISLLVSLNSIATHAQHEQSVKSLQRDNTRPLSTDSASSRCPCGPALNLDLKNGATLGADDGAPMIRLRGAAGSIQGLEWMQPGDKDLWRLQTDPAGGLQLYAYKPLTAGAKTLAGTYSGNLIGFSQGNSHGAPQINLGALTIQNVEGVPSSFQTYGALENFTNIGPTVGYGHRLDCYTSASGDGFDLCGAIIDIVRAESIPNATSYMAQWIVQVSPQTRASNWVSIAGEINPVNRGDDLGWGASRGQFPRWTGGYQIVPESATFGEPGTGHNTLFGLAIAASGSKNDLGKFVKTYNGILIEKNSIGPGGRGVFIGGDTERKTSDYPFAPLQVGDSWLHGIDLTNANFNDGFAARLAPGQGIGWIGDHQTAELKATSIGERLDLTISATEHGVVTIESVLHAAKGETVAGELTADVIVAKSVRSGVVRVSELPICDQSTEGTRLGVLDAKNPSFLDPLIGGGTVHSPAYCNGVAWVAG